MDETDMTVDTFDANDRVEATARRMSKIGYFMLLLVIIFFVVVSVLYLPIFKVDHIVVKGNYFVSREDILRIAGIYRGQHVFEAETAKATKTLMKDLRIEQAVVRREFPNGITIDIEERRPVACVACEYGYLDIDRTGMVLRAYKTRPYQEIPLLTGVKVNDLYIGDRVKSDTIKAAAQYLSGLDDAALAQITELSLIDPGYVVASTTSAVEIQIGELANLEEKSRITQDFLNELPNPRQPIEALNMVFAQPYVKSRAGQ